MYLSLSENFSDAMVRYLDSIESRLAGWFWAVVWVVCCVCAIDVAALHGRGGVFEIGFSMSILRC